MEKLREEAGAEAAAGRIVIAHLGNGASMAAVQRRKGHRHHDGANAGRRADDGHPLAATSIPACCCICSRKEDAARRRWIIWSITARGCSASRASVPTCATSRAARRRSPRRRGDRRCTAIMRRSSSAALAAALGGLDTLVFTAGIGTNAADDPLADLPGAGVSGHSTR